MVLAEVRQHLLLEIQLSFYTSIKYEKMIHSITAMIQGARLRYFR